MKNLLSFSKAINFGFILMLAGTMTMMSCKGGGAGKMIGTYSLSIDDMELSDEEKGMMGMMANAMKMELKKDGVFSMSMMGQSEEGTYKISGSEITMTVKGDDQKGKIDGNKISIDTSDEGGPILVFKKD